MTKAEYYDVLREIRDDDEDPETWDTHNITEIAAHDPELAADMETARTLAIKVYKHAKSKLAD